MRKMMLACIVAGLALAGCGGGGTKTGSPSGTNSTASTSGGTSAGSDYCKLAKQYQSDANDVSDAFKNIDYSDPAKAKQQLADAYKQIAPKYKAILAQSIAAAPAEIKADLTTLGEALVKFLDALEKNGYDFQKIAQDPAFTQTFADPKFREAANRVGEYGARACGIAYTPEPAAS